ncbi:MAG: GNAT family N-acetyltransferase [Alicyclobacillus sp.]|nr:GNAT family N-acetyltransferase [Alicyclobacillus sp.]
MTIGAYTISTDPERLDINVVYEYLHNEAYWSKGISRNLVERSIRNSLCFGVYHGMEMAGLARVISDYATFAYLGDVFVLPKHRGQGLSKRLMEAISSHPDLQGLRRFHLVTSDAHGLYSQFGFRVVAEPGRHMERVTPAYELYSQPRGEMRNATVVRP